MAFRQPTAPPLRHFSIPTSLQLDSTPIASTHHDDEVEQSQEWVLFSPSQDNSTLSRTQTTSSQPTPRTVGLSRISDLDSLDTAARSGRLESTVLEEDASEDRELDSLDDGLHAFEPSVYPTPTNQGPGAVLPAHDGLGTFPASSLPVQEQLWQHEQYNPKRKFDGHHHRRSSVQRRLDTIEEFESHMNDDKIMRIEKWRMEQSRALVDEIEKETRRRLRRKSPRESVVSDTVISDDILGTTPKASDMNQIPLKAAEDGEPFWRRITRRFIREVIGIDEPLLSVILGESLPPEAYEPPVSAVTLPTIPDETLNGFDIDLDGGSWRDRLLRRIARELGILVNQLSPHPGAFSTFLTPTINDYAGIPISKSANISVNEDPVASRLEESGQQNSASLNPIFSPTGQDPSHDASWGLEEEIGPSTPSAAPTSDAERLRREREYWERELDVKMVFRYLKDRLSYDSSAKHTSVSYQSSTPAQESARRAAIIRQHHPLVARAHQATNRVRRDSRTLSRRASSCASESVKSSHRASLVWSGGSSRNYWDLGGSVGSGSIFASGGMMGAWGEA